MAVPSCDDCDNNVEKLCHANPPTVLMEQVRGGVAGDIMYWQPTTVRPMAYGGCRSGWVKKEEE